MKKFRCWASTLNYLSLDRSDVQYAAKEICTTTVHPTQGSWKGLKKGARYLKAEKVDLGDAGMGTRRDEG